MRESRYTILDLKMQTLPTLIKEKNSFIVVGIKHFDSFTRRIEVNNLAILKISL